MDFLQTLALLLAAAVLAVPLTRFLGFGSILGYLLAGLVIGPAGLGLVTSVDAISEVAEFGVIMLLFLIGLELRPARLWTMRRAVLGLGGGQMLLCGGILVGLTHLAGQDWPASVVIGFGLAMSSTAIVLPMLAERDLLATRAGRDAFSVLLFQDMAFIPLVALVPILGGGKLTGAAVAGPAILRAVAALALVMLGGRYLIRPVFRVIARLKAQEIFTAAALLVVAGTAVLVSAAGLSMSLGAFMAGVLLSDSEYRHELQADIEPFEGLLLGFFFISVGMQANLSLLISQPGLVLVATLVLILVKGVVCFGIARLGGQSTGSALRFACVLPQGSEFGFVLFGAAVAGEVMGARSADLAMLVVALSMIANPILFAAEERWLAPWLERSKERAFDRIESSDAPVIICGFGRIGQIVGRILRLQHIAFTALDRDAGQVDIARRFGSRVYYGDPTRTEVLRAAGAETAKAIVVALDDADAAVRMIDTVRRHFPHLAIFARARNRHYAHLMMDRGVEHVVRETLHSSLVLSRDVLEGLGIAPAEAERAVTLFREHDERTLIQQLPIHSDEKQLIQSTKAARDELQSLFEADRPEPRAVG